MLCFLFLLAIGHVQEQKGVVEIDRDDADWRKLHPEDRNEAALLRASAQPWTGMMTPAWDKKFLSVPARAPRNRAPTSQDRGVSRYAAALRRATPCSRSRVSLQQSRAEHRQGVDGISKSLLPTCHYKRCMLLLCHRNFKMFLHTIEQSSFYLGAIAVKFTPNIS